MMGGLRRRAARRRAWWAAAGLAAAVAPWLVGCASSAAPGAGALERGSPPAAEENIAAVHVSKCGACHTLPGPRTRTREHLEEAFSRHRRRVRLTKDEWSAMLDYLAMPDGATARQP